MVYNCPRSRTNAGRNVASNLQISVGLMQRDEMIIPMSWILLNTCSTASVCNNVTLLRTIEDCSDNDSLKVFINGGSKTFHKRAPLKMLLISMYYNEDSIANILVFTDVVSIPGVQITMDTDKERAMNITYVR